MVELLQDGSRLQYTAEGRVELITPSAAELSMKDILASVAERGQLENWAVGKALCGHFGRLERDENEAFLRMRAVRSLNESDRSLQITCRIMPCIFCACHHGTFAQTEKSGPVLAWMLPLLLGS